MPKKNKVIEKMAVYEVLQRIQEDAMQNYRNAVEDDCQDDARHWQSFMSALTYVGLKVDKL